MDYQSDLPAGSCRWHRLRTTLLALVASLFLGAPASAGAAGAQEISQEGEVVRLTVQVRAAASNEMLLGAVIELAGVVSRYVTGVDGRAVMDVPRGRYRLTVRRWGYEPSAGDLEVIRPGEFTVAMGRAKTVDLDAPATLLVRVVDGESGDAIQGAPVSLLEGGSRVTDSNGLAEFGDLRLHVAQFTVETIGYAKRTAPVALHPGNTTAARVEMTVETAALKPIEIEKRSHFLEASGLYDRLADGKRTHVLTRGMLDQLAGTQLSHAFSAMSGIRVDRLASGGMRLVTRRQCSLGLYVDGIRRGIDRVNARGRFVLDDLPPESLELIEVWERRRGCGSILIWTR